MELEPTLVFNSSEPTLNKGPQILVKVYFYFSVLVLVWMKKQPSAKGVDLAN